MAAENPEEHQPSASGSRSGEVDTAADRFEAAWRAGEEPAINEFVEVATEDGQGSSRRELLAELVGIDLEWRWRRAAEQPGEPSAPAEATTKPTNDGEPPAAISGRPLLEHYVVRYPALAPLDTLPQELVAHEYYVRRRWGDRPGHEEYQERFRSQWAQLEENLAEVDEELGPDAAGVDRLRVPSAEETTLAYCIATADGKIRPLLDALEEAQLQSVFAVGTRVQDRYTLEGDLGRGGMGHVYLARDARLSRLVAIKVVVDPTGEGRGVLEEALAEEARLGAVLDHPAIATVFDFGFHEGRPFAVFEYVDGDTLRDVLRRRQRIPVDEVRRIIGSLAEALDFAHGRGIVHRDLKPENIRASKQGPFKILDLGLAKEYRRSEDWTTFAGTPAYASPEQAAGLPSDGRADQYALALITYEMLTGRRVYNDTDPLSLLRLHCEEDPTPPNVHMPELPESVNLAIVRALDKDPNRRFATCEDYASALGPVHPDHGQGHVFDQREPKTINVYVCHAGEDSGLACDLAESLERRGFSTWYYERDTLPGISYVSQCANAIERSEAFLLLISSHSLASQEVTMQVRHAYGRSRRFLPLLVDLSQADFQRREPEWRTALGTAAIGEMRSGNLETTVERLTKTLALWHIRPDRTIVHGHAVDPEKPDLDAVRKIWASDANQIDIRDLERVVFRNEIIDDFLNRRGKCFLSANKGLGKTLLLTYKRYLLAETYGTAKEGKEHHHVFFVPEGKPYLDFMSDVRSLSKTHDEFLSELVNAKRMWGFALRVSALSYHPSLFTANDADELALLPRRLRHWVQGARIEPTVVFKEMLGRSVREINRVIDETENFLDHKLRLVHSGTLFFIDKVDQGIRHLSRSGWVSVQAGLIEAAWDAMNTNSHIKVHATIRQEAFSNYESDIKANLYGATTMIQYSEDDLQRLLDQLTQCYEGSQSFKRFVNLNVVKHPHRAFPEDSFQYVRRHTLGRPRDLVIISSELSTQQSSLSEPVYRRLVNDTSAAVLVSNVFDEMRAFLDCLHDKGERLRFFSLLPHNILTRDEAIGICCQLNNIRPEDYKFYADDAGQLHHPFCELYRAGLLGVVATDPDSHTAIQRFKQPHDLVNDFESSVPETPFYLIHPALDGCIRKYRTSGVYNVFHHVAVGHGQPWEDHFGAACNVERILFSVTDKPLRELVHDVLKRAAVVLKEGGREPLRTAMEASKEWETLREKLIADEHDDLYLLLEELIDGG